MKAQRRMSLRVTKAKKSGERSGMPERLALEAKIRFNYINASTSKILSLSTAKRELLKSLNSRLAGE
jgi:hypothetical protein